MDGNTFYFAFLNYVSATISSVPKIFKEQIQVLRGFGRARQGHKFSLSQDLDHECPPPDKFREGKMGRVSGP